MASLNARWSTAGMLVAGLGSAPCFIGIMLLPLGLGAVTMSSVFTFLDEFRILFMIGALALLAISHWALHRAQEFRPTGLVWAFTVVVLVLIVGELIVDPPWARHALVPM